MARGPTTVKAVADDFAEHIRELKLPGFEESQLRVHYLDPFWKLLGWDVDNSKQRPSQDVEVQVESSIDTIDEAGSRTFALHYVSGLHGFSRHAVEGKRPPLDIDADKAELFHVERYAVAKYASSGISRFDTFHLFANVCFFVLRLLQ